MNTALDYAKYIINHRYIEKRNPVNNFYLQKVLYVLQKDNLKRTGKLLFEDSIEAWNMGPVVPNVYYVYCHYGVMPITETYKTLEENHHMNSIIDAICEAAPWTCPKYFKSNFAWEKSYKRGKFSPIKIKYILKEIEEDKKYE